MDNYLLLGDRILRFGRIRGDRTKTGTRSIRSCNLIWDMREGFPLVTTKKINLRSVLHELIWILNGETNVQYLIDNGCGFIWKPWSVSEDVIVETPIEDAQRLLWVRNNNPEAYAELMRTGFMRLSSVEGNEILDTLNAPTVNRKVTIKAGETNAPYGPNWRRWKGRNGEVVDQIEYMLNLLRTNPESRRIMLSAWDPANMPDESISPQENVLEGNPCLTPCHYAIEMYADKMTLDERVHWLTANNPFAWDNWVKTHGVDAVDDLDAFLDGHEVPKHFLDLKWMQRSCDYAVGIPYNIASYGALLLMFSKTLNMVARELEMVGGNVHLYSNHVAQFVQQFSRTPRERPTLNILNKRDRLEDYVVEDFELVNYNPHDFIKYEVSV